MEKLFEAIKKIRTLKKILMKKYNVLIIGNTPGIKTKVTEKKVRPEENFLYKNNIEVIYDLKPDKLNEIIETFIKDG